MPPPAIFATRSQRPREVVYNRDPNRDTLRASVLDVALELGIGTSWAVENLIFDSVMEEDESVTTPTLTSEVTSDESWPLVPSWNPADVVLPVRKPTSVARTPTPDLQAARARSEDSHTPTPPLPHQPRKLRKARKDGYESDGGYISDNSKKKKKDKKDQKKVSESSFGPEYQSDGEHLSDLMKSGVDKKKKRKDKGNKMSDDLGANSSIKMSNVSTKKSRIPSDDGDVSDGGYLLETTGKKKRSFFIAVPNAGYLTCSRGVTTHRAY
ncbi:hypothetical protein F5888DRAFT_126957 [Russula emetica]|nr:hypothetical protein F5888DRAFT_126957 [Russula emetica]